MKSKPNIKKYIHYLNAWLRPCLPDTERDWEILLEMDQIENDANKATKIHIECLTRQLREDDLFGHEL